MKELRITRVRLGTNVQDALHLCRKLGCSVEPGGMGYIVKHSAMRPFNLMGGRHAIPIEFMRWINALLLYKQTQERVTLGLPEEAMVPTGQLLEAHAAEMEERDAKQREIIEAQKRAAEEAAHARKEERRRKKAERHRLQEEEAERARAVARERERENVRRIEAERSAALNVSLLSDEALDALAGRISMEFQRRYQEGGK